MTLPGKVIFYDDLLYRKHLPIILFFSPEFQKVYERLNVKLIERGESFYQNKMKDLVDSLEKEGT